MSPNDPISVANQKQFNIETERLRVEASDLGLLFFKVIDSASNRDEISFNFIVSQPYSTFEVEYKDSATLKKNMDLLANSNFIARFKKFRNDVKNLITFAQYPDIVATTQQSILAAGCEIDKVIRLSFDFELECDDKRIGNCDWSDVFSTGTRLYLNNE